jgi:ABC-type multidrug transport system fused ATPase/permease subunit
MFTYGVAGEKLTMRLRGEMFEAMVRQEVAWFDKKSNSSGSLCARLSGDASSVQGVSNCIYDSTKEVKGEVIPIHAVKAYGGSGGIAQLILNLGTRWMLVVSPMSRLLLTHGRSPWYPFDRRLGRPQS